MEQELTIRQLSDRPLDAEFQHTPLPAPDYIRVINTYPANSLLAPLRAEIDVLHLDQSAVFEALSYSWGMDSDGDDSLSRTMAINGRVKHITQNLYEGLLRLREDAWPLPRRLWVDAVCINQADIDERSEQVLRMSDIYSYATNAVVWLGEGVSDREDANVQATAECLDQAEGTSHIHGTHIWRGASGEQHCICCLRLHRHLMHWGQLAGRSPAELSAPTEVLQSVADLLKRRYFNRRWIVQELWSSRRSNIKAYWGTHSCSLRNLQSLASALVSLVIKQRPQRGFPISDNRSELFESLLRAHNLLGFVRDLSSGRSSASLPFLLEALGASRHMECSDDRDILNSLLSIDPGFGLVPDYSLSFSVVCIQFARRSIEKQGLAFVLQRGPQRDGAELPSWVPDIRAPLGSFVAQRLDPQYLNINLSGDNTLIFSPYLFGLVHGIRHTKEASYISFKYFRKPHLRRWVGAVPTVFNAASQSSEMWIQARECLEKNKYWGTGTVEVRFGQLDDANEIRPGDLCCSLTTKLTDYDGCVFILRPCDMEDAKFSLIRSINMDDRSDDRVYENKTVRVGFARVRFLRAVLRITVNIV